MDRLDYKEIISAIDVALYSVFLSYHGNMRDTDEELCLELAEASLAAIQAKLPNLDNHKYITYWPNGVKCSVNKPKAVLGYELYKQLKELKPEVNQ